MIKYDVLFCECSWDIAKRKSPYCRAKMYAGCVTWGPLVRSGEYANGTDRQRDRHQTITLCLPLWTQPALL